jgi:uncharacterized protein YlxW (UPF0749 family)
MIVRNESTQPAQLPAQRFRLSVLLVSVILGFMVAVQVTTSRQPHTSVGDIMELRSELLQEQDQQKSLSYQLAQAQAQLLKYQQNAGSKQSMLQAVAGELQNIRQQAGLEPAKGPGIVITISNDPALAKSVPDSHVYDFNLIAVVNLLFSNGADAVAINGQRIVTISSIREVGVMEINTHPVMMPYVITAIGDVSQMEAALTVNHLAADYKEIGNDFQVAEHRAPDFVTVPAYANPVHFQYATTEVNQGK